MVHPETRNKYGIESIQIEATSSVSWTSAVAAVSGVHYILHDIELNANSASMVQLGPASGTILCEAELGSRGTVVKEDRFVVFPYEGAILYNLPLAADQTLRLLYSIRTGERRYGRTFQLP